MEFLVLLAIVLVGSIVESFVAFLFGGMTPKDAQSLFDVETDAVTIVWATTGGRERPDRRSGAVRAVGQTFDESQHLGGAVALADPVDDGGADHGPVRDPGDVSRILG